MWVGLTLKEKFFFSVAELKVLCPTDFLNSLFLERYQLPSYYSPIWKIGTICTKFSKSKATHVLSSQDNNVGQPVGSSTALSETWVMTTVPMEGPAISVSVLDPHSDLYKTLRNLIIFDTFIPNCILNQAVVGKIFIVWNTDQHDHKSFLFLGS